MHLEVRQSNDVVILDLKGKLTAGFGDQLLREAIECVPETFAYANNHYAGHGPETIRQLAALVSGAAEPAE